VTRIVAFESILDLLAVERDHDRPAVWAGEGVLAVVEGGEQVDDRSFRQRRVTRDRGITRQIREQGVGHRVYRLARRSVREASQRVPQQRRI
jgi:hypothetical protein